MLMNTSRGSNATSLLSSGISSLAGHDRASASVLVFLAMCIILKL